MKTDRTKILETSLVLTTGFLVIYFISSDLVFLYVSFAFGFIGIFIKPLARYIAIAWFKLADILNFVVSRIVLGILFFIILFPVSIFYRIKNRNKMKMKHSENSNWVPRNVKYTSADLHNLW